MIHSTPERIPNLIVDGSKKVYKKHLYDLAELLTPAEIAEARAKREAERIAYEADESWLTDELEDDTEFFNECELEQIIKENV